MKTFVLDANVLIHDPESIIKFPHSRVVIPLTVIEELDKLKRNPSDVGRNARVFFRFLDSIACAGIGDLRQGVKLDNGSTIFIEMKIKTDFEYSIDLDVKDNQILLAAYYLKDQGEQVVFVSKDFAARIKAEALGLESEDYENLKYSYDNVYRGIRKLQLSKHDVDLFYKDGTISIEQDGWSPNEYCVMTSPENSSAIGKYHQPTKQVVSLLKQTQLWGIKPRNIEQRCAVDLLLRDDIKLVTLTGPAGTGKTLLALACGLRKVFDENNYTKILISRPVVPLGRDIGYLPGTKEEKLFHWMQPIYDNLEFLCGSSGSGDPTETMLWVTDSKKIEMEAVTYIRGRSLPKMYIIIDEAQNLTPHEVKTIVSRAGEGTKVVLTGDPTQIDHPYLDKDSNGLSYAIGRFKDHPIFGQIYLEKTERSELAAIAAERL